MTKVVAWKRGEHNFRLNPGQLVKNALIIQCNLWLEGPGLKDALCLFSQMSRDQINCLLGKREGRVAVH